MNEREFLNLVAQDSSFLVAAHEMKTPLSIIRQLSLTLTDNEIDLSSSERDRILRQINTTSERALRLVQELTKISKLEDAMFELEPISSKKICGDVISEISDVFKLHGRVIRFKNVRKSELIVRVRKVPAWVCLLRKVLRLQWGQKLVLFGIAMVAHFISI